MIKWYVLIESNVPPGLPLAAQVIFICTTIAHHSVWIVMEMGYAVPDERRHEMASSLR